MVTIGSWLLLLILAVLASPIWPRGSSSDARASRAWHGARSRGIGALDDPFADDEHVWRSGSDSSPVFDDQYPRAAPAPIWINPASGSPMLDGPGSVDVGGNPWGQSMFDDHLGCGSDGLGGVGSSCGFGDGLGCGIGLGFDHAFGSGSSDDWDSGIGIGSGCGADWDGGFGISPGCGIHDDF